MLLQPYKSTNFHLFCVISSLLLKAPMHGFTNALCMHYALCRDSPMHGFTNARIHQCTDSPMPYALCTIRGVARILRQRRRNIHKIVRMRRSCEWLHAHSLAMNAKCMTMRWSEVSTTPVCGRWSGKNKLDARLLHAMTKRLTIASWLLLALSQEINFMINYS